MNDEQLKDSNLFLQAQINALVEMQRDRLKGYGWTAKEVDACYNEKVQSHLTLLKEKP